MSLVYKAARRRQAQNSYRCSSHIWRCVAFLPPLKGGGSAPGRESMWECKKRAWACLFGGSSEVQDEACGSSETAVRAYESGFTEGCKVVAAVRMVGAATVVVLLVLSRPLGTENKNSRELSLK